MNSKFLMFAGCLLFTAGCSQSVNVAKTDIPEDEMIASQPVVIQPDQKMAKMDQEEVGYSDFKHKVVKRGIASEDGGESVALGGNSDPENDERTAPVDGISPTPVSYASDNEPSTCNTLAYAKARLHVTDHTGNAANSMNAWLGMPGFTRITAAEARNLDFCVYSGGRRGVGTIIMKEAKGWGDGCRTYKTLPHPHGYHMIGCVRPAKHG